uniref:TATA box-binding protein-associated factor RNA polymerase I subunit B n=1 Tax=Parastrongyloides trichosuri TaxID=131310 RepID=A0A0N4ZYU8_PARTI
MGQECNSCQSTEFFLDDGFYYCKDCGEKSDVIEFQRVEDTTQKYASAFKTKQNEDLDVEKKRDWKVVEQFYSRSHHLTFGYNQALYRVACRISAASQMLNSIFYTLIKECSIPKEVSEVGFGIFQKYLAKSKVAFCEEELNDGSEDPFFIEIPLKPYELKKLIKEKQKKMVDEVTDKIHEELLNLNLFECKDNSSTKVETKSNITVTLKPEEYYKTKRTSISRKALDRTGLVYLEIDLLFSIVHISLIYSGIHYIQMSDLMRWFREGRFPITQDHLNDLQMLKQDKDLSGYMAIDRLRLEKVQKTKSSPLTKQYYAHMFIWQYLSLPPLIIPSDAFDELIERYIYDLNLPKMFLNRIKLYKKYCNVLKNKSCDIWKANFPILENFNNTVGENCTNSSDISLSKFYDVCLPKILYSPNNPPKYTYIDFSIEVKAMAFILFSLKHEFSLNGNNEFENIDGEEYFNFINWLKQLNLRSQLADGRSLNYVISERNLNSFYYYKSTFLTRTGCQFSEFSDILDSEFSHQIPSKQRMFMAHKCMSDCIEDFIKKPRNIDNDENLFAPIKFYGEECSCENDLEENDDTVLLIKKNFFKYRLKDFKDIITKGHYLYPINDYVTGIRLEEKLGSNKSSRCNICFNTQNLLTIYENVRDSLPTSFNQLLYLLSKIIGEWPHILYFAFLVIENSIINKDELRAIRTSLLEGKMIKIGKTSSKNDSFVLYSEDFQNDPFNFIFVSYKKKFFTI